MGEKEFQVDMNYVRTLDELTELAQTTFETNAALSLQLVETGRPVLRINDDLLVSNLQAGAKISATSLRVGFRDVHDDQQALQILGFDGDKIPE